MSSCMAQQYWPPGSSSSQVNKSPRPGAQCNLPAPVLLADAVLALAAGLWQFDVCNCIIRTHRSQVGQPLFARDVNFWQNGKKGPKMQESTQFYGFGFKTFYQYRFGMITEIMFFEEKMAQLILPKFAWKKWDLQVLVLGQRARNIAFGLKRSVSIGLGTCPWCLYDQNRSFSGWKWHLKALDFEMPYLFPYFQTTLSEGRAKKRKSYHVRIPGPIVKSHSARDGYRKF